MAYKRCGEPKSGLEIKDWNFVKQTFVSFKKERILVLLFLIVAVSQGYEALLELTFQGITHDTYPMQDEQTSFLYTFYAALNSVATFFQLVVTPLALSFIPLGIIHLSVPLLNIASCVVFLIYPSLTTAAIAFLTFKVMDYSIFRAAKEILYIPLSFDGRYRGKLVVDVFGYRLSQGITPGTVSGAWGIGLVVTEFSLAIGAVAIGGLWCLLVLPIMKRKK